MLMVVNMYIYKSCIYCIKEKSSSETHLILASAAFSFWLRVVSASSSRRLITISISYTQQKTELFKAVNSLQLSGARCPTTHTHMHTHTHKHTHTHTHTDTHMHTRSDRSLTLSLSCLRLSLISLSLASKMVSCLRVKFSCHAPLSVASLSSTARSWEPCLLSASSIALECSLRASSNSREWASCKEEMMSVRSGLFHCLPELVYFTVRQIWSISLSA